MDDAAAASGGTMTTYGSVDQRTSAVAAGRPRKMPHHTLANHAGQKGTVRTKIQPSGIVNLGIRKGKR